MTMQMDPLSSQKGIPFSQKHRMALRGAALVVVLTVPVALNHAARSGNQAGLWGLIAVMAAGMALVVWAG